MPDLSPEIWKAIKIAVLIIVLFSVLIGAVKLLAQSGDILHYLVKKFKLLSIKSKKNDMEFAKQELQDLMSELRYYLSSNPTTVSGRQRLREDISFTMERIQGLTDNIELLKNAGISMADFSAGMITQPNALDFMVTEKIKDLSRFSEIHDLEHQQTKESFEAVNKQTSLNFKKQKSEIDKNKADNEKIRAEADQIKTNSEAELLLATAEYNLKNARTIYEIDKAEFIRDTLSQIDIKKLPPELQAYITATVFNPEQKPFDDFEMFKKLQKYVEIEAQLKTDRAREDVNYRKKEVENLNIENDFKKSKYNQEVTKKKLNGN